MANEAIITYSGFYYIITSASSTTNASFDSGTRISLSSSGLSANEQLYPLLDFHLSIYSASTAPDENATVDLYRFSTSSPTPSGNYKEEYVGSFTLDNLTGSQNYYLYGVPNNLGDTFITQNNSGVTLSYHLRVRARSLEPGA